MTGVPVHVGPGVGEGDRYQLTVVGRGAVVYEANGSRALRTRTASSEVTAVAMGELGPGQGRELVIAVGQYGLATLGNPQVRHE